MKPLGEARSGWNWGRVGKTTDWQWVGSRAKAISQAAASCRSAAMCGKNARLEVEDASGNVVLERHYRALL